MCAGVSVFGRRRSDRAAASGFGGGPTTRRRAYSEVCKVACHAKALAALLAAARFLRWCVEVGSPTVVRCSVAPVEL